MRGFSEISLLKNDTEGLKMNISEMFEKQIDRDIKGVIKVGQHDQENIYQELNEYVVTQELSKHFREFFEIYRKGIEGPTDDMGVWISGFFGSGKSHFLKILSYILENKEVKGRKAINFFKEDNKIDDALVLADMSAAENVSTDVILFNIDSKAEYNKEPIINVFLRVFNDMQGFCEENPFLADLERNLTKEELFSKFKIKFKEINGDEWVNKRSEFIFIQDEIIETLVDIGSMSKDAAKNWAEKVNEDYTISIENFAELVKEYCESKGDNHHLIFLVDEIGQYIGDNSKLMLNLQTVTEDLGIMCQGKAWIIVTSQQDIDILMKVPGNDFSKIQGRFKTRLSLSSANVDEVIRKRILAKNPTATLTLEALYEEKEAILKNLISFSADTAEKKMYVDSKDFATVYPFIPYQFNLLQNVLTAIREHGASGKHLAEGERSMLALFQESAISLMDKELGVLMPFNIYYNALDKFIDHTHRSVIIKAMDNQFLDEFDVEVLKVLFMIKYVKEIKANQENLTTLMVSDIDEDRVVLREKIEKSLKRLVGQTLVQKNGDIYSFLTNDEREITIAIKHEHVDTGETLNEASNIIFEDIFPYKKYRFSNRYNFPFNQVIDDQYRGNKQSADIGVRIITYYHELKDSIEGSQTLLSEQSQKEKTSTILRGLSDNNNEVIIHLTDDMMVLDEIEELLQINKYLTKHSAELSVRSKSILIAKQQEVSEKKERIKLFLEEALKHADIYVKGDKVDIKEKNPTDRINDALNKLVKKIYHKLHYMKTAPIKSDIINILRDTSQEKFGKSDNVDNHLAIDDLDRYIEQETNVHSKPSLKAILNRYNKAPYGFVDLDIEWLIATLFAQKRIYLVKNAQNISLKTNSAEDILKFITERKFQDKILIDKKQDTSKPKIEAVKEVLRDFFDIVNITDDDEALMEIFQAKSTIKLSKIKEIDLEYQIEKIKYPGKKVIEESKDLLRDVTAINSLNQFFDFVSERKEDFLDIAEDLESILNFFEGAQKDIFKTACKVTDLYNKNKNFIKDPELKKIDGQIRNIIEMPNPFSHIHELPELYDEFDSLHQITLENESEPIKRGINADLNHVLEELDSDNLKLEFEETFKQRFYELEDKLINSQEISVIKGIREESNNLVIGCLSEVDKFREETDNEREEVTGPTTPKPKKKKKYLNIKTISRTTRLSIKNEDDIDYFLENLRKELKKELKDNDEIDLSI